MYYQWKIGRICHGGSRNNEPLVWKCIPRMFVVETLLVVIPAAESGFVAMLLFMLDALDASSTCQHMLVARILQLAARILLPVHAGRKMLAARVLCWQQEFCAGSKNHTLATRKWIFELIEQKTNSDGDDLSW